MIALCCIKPETKELLERACEDYRKFKGIDELPENVYGAFYWLMRYSGLVDSTIQQVNRPNEKCQCKAWESLPLVACKQGFRGMCGDEPCTLRIFTLNVAITAEPVNGVLS